MSTEETETTPEPQTPEQPTPGEPGTMPGAEPEPAPEPATMPEEPDVSPSEPSSADGPTRMYASRRRAPALGCFASRF
jgi:hypothetical protein